MKVMKSPSYSPSITFEKHKRLDLDSSFILVGGVKNSGLSDGIVQIRLKASFPKLK